MSNILYVCLCVWVVCGVCSRRMKAKRRSKKKRRIRYTVQQSCTQPQCPQPLNVSRARTYNTSPTYLNSNESKSVFEPLAFCDRFLRRPAYVQVGEIGSAVDRIEQRVVFVKSEAEKKKVKGVAIVLLHTLI